MQAPGELVRQSSPLPRSAVMMVPGVGCGDLYPFVFSFEWKVPYGAGLEQSTKVMYNIPGWRGLERGTAIMPG
jgi:hypothetical protein